MYIMSRDTSESTVSIQRDHLHRPRYGRRRLQHSRLLLAEPSSNLVSQFRSSIQTSDRIPSSSRIGLLSTCFFGPGSMTAATCLSQTGATDRWALGCSSRCSGAWGLCERAGRRNESGLRSVNHHAKFIDGFEGVAVPGPGVWDRTVDHGISGRMIDRVFAHGMTANRAGPHIGGATLL